METVIEIVQPQNRSVLFQPTSEVLRGRWSLQNLPGQTMHASLLAMPDVPGVCLAIDTQARAYRRYDPLEKDRSLWDRVKAVMDANRQHFGDMQPWPEVVQQDLDDDAIKTFLWWMRRLVDSRSAVVTQGTLPTLDEIIQLPGAARIGQFNSVAPRHFSAEKDSKLGQQALVRANRARPRREPTATPAK